MQTRHRSQSNPALWLAAAALLALSFVPARTHAEDGEHGGAPGKPNANNDIHQPGPAVLAPRITERYSEPGMTENPIAIDFDPRGNLYIAEGWRAGNAVLDNRNPSLIRARGVIDDLQKQSVEDRAKQIQFLIEGGYFPADQFTKQSDKVRLLKDTNDDGIADQSTIFADGFNDPLDGIASGVLVHDGRVYLTNIPHLWLLEDKDGDGDADEETQGERTSLSYGWGVRWTFYGHDMHGLIKGPDGRIYFSIGDRGFNVTTKEGKQLVGTDRGGVFRMWPDGSGLELYFQGLRNPQELAFDNYGNLFTGDNNCDKGDLARFVYLPEGGDSGWRQDVQSLDSGGPWLRERMWEPRLSNNDPIQPAWIIHPIANVGRGPSGLAHYPGTGDAFPQNGSFLMCDYPAGVRHVLTEPDGAGFKVVQDSAFVDGGTITDVTWGYDGRLYLSDWGGGWQPNPNGYVKTMVNKAAHAEQAEVIAEVKSLFAEGFDELSDEKLIELLGHADQRVRIHAQWELATHAPESALVDAIENESNSELKRLHALWAMGMASRHTLDHVIYIEPLLKDQSAVLRAHAASVLAELSKRNTDDFVLLLNDDSPVVQHHAAIALGKTGTTKDVGPLLDLFERNNNDDVTIRHAVVYSLSLIGDAEAIHNEVKERSPAARLGVVLALRRLDSPLLAEYLDDDDALTAAEAARAIYDRRIMDAMPALAALADTLPPERMIEPVMRRVIEANVRLADADSAKRLARLASNPDAPQPWRILALQELDTWSAERNREGVWGSWWPRPEQTMDHALSAMTTALPAIIASEQGQVRTMARIAELRHVASPTVQQLIALANHADEPHELRFAATEQLVGLDQQRAVETAFQNAISLDAPIELRELLRELLLELDIEKAMKSYLFAARQGETSEKQEAVRQLGQMQAPEAHAAVGELAADLQRGNLAADLRLDVYEAITANNKLPAKIRGAAMEYVERNAIAGEAPFIRDALLSGGAIERGRHLFLNHAAADCKKCHTVGGSGSVGPDLGNVGVLHDANYLYDALVNPHRHIAEGYATSSITLKDGSVKTGRIVKDKSTPAALVLANIDGIESEVQRQHIHGVPATSDQSMMPSMKDKLSPRDLRDVLAYLGSLKGGGSAQPGGASADAGPHVLKPAASVPHHIVLPLFLMGIFVSLGLLLLVTVLGGGQVAQ